MSSDKQLQIIKDICQKALDSTVIKIETDCNHTHDYYMLGKVDMAEEILKAIKRRENANKKD
tara:strand:- start:118 stop:303 length:186 start_codon:yes stop_codon:yes gene_type:complete